MNIDEHNAERDFHNIVTKMIDRTDLIRFQEVTVSRLLKDFINYSLLNKLLKPDTFLKFYWELSTLVREGSDYIKVLDMSYEDFKLQYSKWLTALYKIENKMITDICEIEYLETDAFREAIREPEGHVIIGQSAWSFFIDTPDVLENVQLNLNSVKQTGCLGTYIKGKGIYTDAFRENGLLFDRHDTSPRFIIYPKKPLDCEVNLKKGLLLPCYPDSIYGVLKTDTKLRLIKLKETEE